MKNSENGNPKVFKGLGFLLGFAIAIVATIAVFVLSNNFGISISASVPIGITLGISLEQKFQGSKDIVNPKATKMLIGLLSLGVLAFIALFFFVNYF